MKPVVKAVDMGGHKLSLVPITRPVIKLDFKYPEDAKRVAEMEKAARNAKTVVRVAQGHEKINHPTKKDEGMGGKEDFDDDWFIVNTGRAKNMGSGGQEDEDWEKL